MEDEMAQARQSKNKLDRELSEGLSESFPASDPPAVTQPGSGITGAEVALADDDHHEKVRRRAYQIWLEEGQAHGRAEEHWREAERAIAAEDDVGPQAE
jgi:Protein of unknown function (DUF2934)